MAVLKRFKLAMLVGERGSLPVTNKVARVNSKQPEKKENEIYRSI